MTKRVRLSGIKAGITLYRVRSFVQGNADAPTRFVGDVERLHVTGRPVPHDLGGATYGWMAYKIHWMAAVEAYDTKSQGWVIGYGHDDGFDGDMGLKGWRQGLYRTSVSGHSSERQRTGTCCLHYRSRLSRSRSTK